jgi:hypothetical protein
MIDTGILVVRGKLPYAWGQSRGEPMRHLASIQTPLEHLPVPRISISRLLAILFPRLLGTGTRRDDAKIC